MRDIPSLDKGRHKVQLCKLTDKDVAIVRKWIMQDYASRWFGDVSDWMKELQGRNDEYSYIKHFIAELDGVRIGFCQYYDWNCILEEGKELEPIATYGIDYLIGNKNYLGKGLGTKIVKAICDKVIETEVNVIQLIADPSVEVGKTNIVSIKVLEKNGFYYNETTKLYIKAQV